MISIILVEDSLAVRKRLRGILDDIHRFRIAGEFDTAQDAIAAIAASTARFAPERSAVPITAYPTPARAAD